MSMCQGDLARKDEGPPLTKRMEVAQAAAKPRKGGEGVGKENVVFDAAARRYRTWVCMSGWSCIFFCTTTPAHTSRCPSSRREALSQSAGQRDFFGRGSKHPKIETKSFHIDLKSCDIHMFWFLAIFLWDFILLFSLFGSKHPKKKCFKSFESFSDFWDHFGVIWGPFWIVFRSF